MIEEARIVILNTPPNEYQKGIVASFVRMNDEWGLKFYFHKCYRDECYERQKLAHAAGCGPAVGDTFEFDIPSMGVLYGYITECIEETLTQRAGRGFFSSDLAGGFYGTKVYQTDYLELIDKLENIFPNEVRDMHSGNIGFMKDGRMVCIDFGFDE